jgi:fumarylacetoacetase
MAGPLDDGWLPVPPDSDFTLANLPFGMIVDVSGDRAAAIRIGDHAIDLARLHSTDALDGLDLPRHLLTAPSLNAFMASGPAIWTATRSRVRALLTDPDTQRLVAPAVLPLDEVEVVLPFDVGDFVDFYSSLQHATNLGRLFRPQSDPLLPNWRHLPVGYHGRAGTCVVSGTPVRRPCGLVADRTGPPVFAPSRELDFELEVGFVVGVGGTRLAPDDAPAHVFGAVLVNDWSARDIQAFEYQPLGPFLGKSFATTISPWIVPLDALTPFLTDPPRQEPEPSPYLRPARPWALDLELSVDLNGERISATNFRHQYWTFAQQLAHLTVNGATTRPGDLFASGAVSGPTPAQFGTLIELTARGDRPIRLADGSQRSFLADGDTVILRGWCGDGARRVGFGACEGTIHPAA